MSQITHRNFGNDNSTTKTLLVIIPHDQSWASESPPPCPPMRFTLLRQWLILSAVCHTAPENGVEDFVIISSDKAVRPSGGPVTVTHPGKRRFFMTIPEADMTLHLARLLLALLRC